MNHPSDADTLRGTLSTQTDNRFQRSVGPRGDGQFTLTPTGLLLEGKVVPLLAGSCVTLATVLAAMAVYRHVLGGHGGGLAEYVLQGSAMFAGATIGFLVLPKRPLRVTLPWSSVTTLAAVSAPNGTVQLAVEASGISTYLPHATLHLSGVEPAALARWLERARGA